MGMKKSKIDARELVKRMRNNMEKERINENEMPDNTTTLTETELDDEKQRFAEAVGSTAEFGDFKIYDSNIEWTGVLPVENIAWSFSLDNNNGCYITVNTLMLNNESLERLTKLSAYYEVWSEYWRKEVNI